MTVRNDNVLIENPENRHEKVDVVFSEIAKRVAERDVKVAQVSFSIRLRI